MRRAVATALWIGGSLAATCLAAPPGNLVDELRRLRWEVDQVTLDCGKVRCPEGRWVEVRETRPPAGGVAGPRLSLQESSPGVLGARRIRLALRLLGEMVHRVEARRQAGTAWLLEEGARSSKGMDGLHRPVDLVRMVERLLRPRAPAWGDAALDEELRRLLLALAGHRPFISDPTLVEALREMAARVGPPGNPRGSSP